MLSLPTVYSAQTQTKNVVSDWLLGLSYTDAVDGDGTLYFSGADRTVTNFYHGNVLEWGTLEQSIDLSTSQSSTADIQITLANNWANVSGLLSAELFGGNKKFINQTTQIYSWIAGCTALTSCLRMHVGRLVDIQHTQETVTLTIETRSPWDRIKFPNVFSTSNRVLFPSAFGDFTRDASTVASKDFTPSKAYFPTPVDAITGAGIMGLLPNISNPSFDSPAFYEKSLDIFVPFDPSNFNEDSAYQGGTAIAAPITLKRGYDFRPVREIDASSTFTNPSYAINGNTSNGASISVTTSDSFGGAFSSGFYYLDIDVPAIDGKLTGIDISIKYDLDLGATSDSDTYIFFYDFSYGTIAPEAEVINQNIAEGTVVSGAETIHSVSGYDTVTWYNSDRYTSANTLPDKIRIACAFGFSGAGTNLTGAVTVYDVFLRLASAVDVSTDEQAGYDKINNIDKTYNGTDGFPASWTGGGSSTVSYPHDIYREMIYRYAGWDAGNIDYVTVNGAVWSTTGTAGISIDSDRDWPCRWWTLDQVKLIDILQQLQFEGAFIWIFDAASTGVSARVIYVKASYSASDHTYDGSDLANIAISTTPLSEIVTTRKFNYQRHPADNSRYLGQNSKANTNIADYNLGALENIVEQNLDFLTASADVDELLTHYDNISGEAKLIVKCDLLKPTDWVTQVGDTATFTNMKYNPYGKDWTTPIYFMCIKTIIGPNKFTAYFREVG